MVLNGDYTQKQIKEKLKNLSLYGIFVQSFTQYVPHMSADWKQFSEVKKHKCKAQRLPGFCLNKCAFF